MFIVRPWRYLWRYKKGEGYSLVRMFVTFFSNCLHDIIDTINVWGMYIYICFCMLMCCFFPYLLFASLPSAIAFLHVFLKHIRRFRDFTLIALRESYLFSSYCIYSFLLFFIFFFLFFRYFSFNSTVWFHVFHVVAMWFYSNTKNVTYLMHNWYKTRRSRLMFLSQRVSPMSNCLFGKSVTTDIREKCETWNAKCVRPLIFI